MTYGNTTYGSILFERRDDVAVITLNRPDRLNAMTGPMSDELTDALRLADAETSIGAVVVTGAGRAFCAGADIKDSFKAQMTGAYELPHWQEWVGVVRATKPIVAAVNGVAYGVGASMILPFDRIVAARSARFSMRFVKVGLVPELGSSYYLPQRVGFGVASDLMLSGRTVEGDEAHRLGLVDELVDDDALLDAAIGRARTYGVNAPTPLRWTKQLLTENATDSDIDRVQARELELLLRCFESDEHKEAVAAFFEKREPKFR